MKYFDKLKYMIDKYGAEGRLDLRSESIEYVDGDLHIYLEGENYLMTRYDEVFVIDERDQIKRLTSYAPTLSIHLFWYAEEYLGQCLEDVRQYKPILNML